jgi:pyruvate formate lyase activating enzyme
VQFKPGEVKMHIIGQQKSSFIDYPDHICTVLFAGGCNFRCLYCHNSTLVYNQGEKINHDETMELLIKRKKYIDAVCISGGEVTLQDDLFDFARQIKEEGFLIKIDTNGTNPDILKKLIVNKVVDYIAMDVKGPFHKYEWIVNSKIDLKAIKESIHIIRKDASDYEFRTTVCKELLSEEDLYETADFLKGSKRYYLQNFRDGDTVLGGIGKLCSYDKEKLEEILIKIKPWFGICSVR